MTSAVLHPGAALQALASPFAAEDLGLSALPLVAIDLRDPAAALDHGDATALASCIRSTPVVIVGICGAETQESCDEIAHSCDVLLANGDHPHLRTVSAACASVPAWPEALDVLMRQTRDHPLAAVALVQLLRLGRDLDVGDALIAESLAYSALLSGPEFARWLSQRPDRHRPNSNASASHSHIPERARYVRTVTKDGELRISLDDPERHNTFSARLRDELVESLRVAATGPTIRKVRIDGVGPSLCSGGDLGEFGTTSDPATAHRIRTIRSAAWWMHHISVPIDLHIHGHAIGAGLELSAFADRVSIHPAAKLSLPEVAMGLIPGVGGTASLPRRIGPQRTAWLALSGETIDAQTALTWGLADIARADYPHAGP